MSTTTTNLKLIKPEATDNVKLSDINENMDKIDATMSGWIPLTGTFTYSNSTTITTGIDCTSFLSAGMKLKCTNGTVKMSVIKSVTSTTIVLESSVLASGAITDVYFSTGQVPYGYSAGDFIVESGTSGIWTYEKWNSGKVICYGNNSASIDCTTQMGSLYYGTLSLTLPSNLFTSILNVQGTAQYGANLIFMTLSEPPSITNVSFFVVASIGFTNTVVEHVVVVGKWK